MTRANARLVLIVLMVFGLLGCVTPPEYSAEPRHLYEPVEWSQVEGWANDGTHEAWSAFLNSCKARGARAEWSAVCAAAKGQTIVDPAGARRFFEAHFEPYRLQKEADAQRPRDTGLITGYYEPLLYGARQPSPTFTVPLYAPPDDLLTIDLASLYPELKGKTLRGRLQGKKVIPYYSRADLDNSPILNGKELAWVQNALDAFYLQVQGSGRVQLTDGQTIRLAYADQNGHPYRSIGRYLVDQGELTLEQATAQGIRDWVETHPTRTREVLNANPSMVFFRAEKIVDASEGPKGALAVPLTPGRSLAVDPSYLPLGAPVFLSTTYPGTDSPLRRLMMAQDTGGAIKGSVRADFFWGFGQSAGESAGRMRQDGRMWLLWPKGQPLPAP
jgi:membrane-bound lytic murein transglycosylase A